MSRAVHLSLPILLSSFSTLVLAADETTSTDNIEQITVQASATANKEPVGTFDAPISNLDYDPRIDLQSRNMAEAQADVSIRGGIFENTGFMVGSATLFDPQSGHYFAEIPIAPQMLTSADVLTGASNAHRGFNSSVGSIAFAWKPIRTGGSLSLGVGNHDFNLQSIHTGVSKQLDSAPQWRIGFEGELSHSQSDGTIENGDHDFTRSSGRIQLASDNSQTDLFYGEQSKFFGWPNLYTPFGFNETEDLKTRLLMLNHQQNYGDNNRFETSAYYRKHQDHYVLSRENPSMFEAFHETEVSAIALAGRHYLNAAFSLNYSAQLVADEITSTSLENNFTSRSYYKLSVLPEYQVNVADNQTVSLRLGAAFDDSNRDDSQISAIGDVSWQTQQTDGALSTVYLSYSQASQVPGYTAIGGSETGGLFRSNHDLGRETSDNLELGYRFEQLSWRIDSALFYRRDDALTDWTYSYESSSAREANAVDIDSLGVEVFANKQFDNAEIIASYTYLEKSEDYAVTDNSAQIDASFYALNYPDHRVTLGAMWQPLDSLELRIDNEWRKQHDNALRAGPDHAFFTQLTLKYVPNAIENLFITLAADNIWDESFQEVPGTPGRGEQYTITATYNW